MKKLLLSTALAVILTPAALAGGGPGQHYKTVTLEDLAYELHAATQELSNETQYAAHHRNGRQADVVRAMRRLERRSLRFFEVVNDRRVRTHRVQNELDRLCNAFEDAKYAVKHVRSKRVRNDFRRVDKLVHRVAKRVERLEERAYYDDRRLERRRPVSRGEVVVGRDGRRGGFRIRLGW